MKGNNTLKLNTATIVEALQEYFDKRYSPKIEVTGVSETAGIFSVSTTDDTRTPAPMMRVAQ